MMHKWLFSIGLVVAVAASLLLHRPRKIVYHYHPNPQDVSSGDLAIAQVQFKNSLAKPIRLVGTECSCGVECLSDLPIELKPSKTVNVNFAFQSSLFEIGVERTHCRVFVEGADSVSFPLDWKIVDSTLPLAPISAN